MANSTRTVRTACPQHCSVAACGILAHVQDERIVKLEPGPFPDPYYDRICLRGLASTRLLYHPDRLKYPMRRIGERGAGRWQRVSWDEALDLVAEGFQRAAEKYGAPAVAWVLGGPGGGTLKLGAYLRLAALTGGTRVSMYGYGDAAGPCASYATFGTLLTFPFTSGFERPELIIFWGTNPAEASPFVMRDVWPAKERGVRVVVIDPRFTPTAAKADQYVPVRPGTDAALALAMMNVIIQNGLHDQAFIRQHTVGPYLVRAKDGRFLRERDIKADGGDGYVTWDGVTGRAVAGGSGENAALDGQYVVNDIACQPAFGLLADVVAEYSPRVAAGITGVSAALIEQLALTYARTKPASIFTHMGVQRTYYGDLSVRAMCTLAAIAGQINLPGSHGHRQHVLNWEAFLRPKPPGGYRRIGVLDMYDAISKGSPYPIKAAYFAFTNFVNQCANTDRIQRDLIGNLDFITVCDMFPNATVQQADVVLPACTFLEHSDLVVGHASGNPYLQLQQRVVAPLHESRSDIWIASQLGKRMGFGEYFDKSEEELVALLLASGHPSMEGINVETLREAPQVAHGATVAQEKGRFKTPSGKIEFYVERLVPFGEGLPVYKEPIESVRQPLARKYPLVYVQGHTRFRTHSMFGNVDWMLYMNPEPVVEINPLDAAPRGIEDGDFVEVYNDRGQTRLKSKITEAVQPGVVNMTEGWWSSQFAKGGVNALTHEAINPAQSAIFEPNMAFNDVLVEVRKVGKE